MCLELHCHLVSLRIDFSNAFARLPITKRHTLTLYSSRTVTFTVSHNIIIWGGCLCLPTYVGNETFNQHSQLQKLFAPSPASIFVVLSCTLLCTLQTPMLCPGNNPLRKYAPLLLFLGMATMTLFLHSDGIIPFLQHQLNRSTNSG